jgi:hypothetical protein
LSHSLTSCPLSARINTNALAAPHTLLPTTQIHNVVCVGHDNLGYYTASITQHSATYSIADDLTKLFEELGKLPETPITIFAQDSGYTANDNEIPSRFPILIKVLENPEGFLAISDNSLVVSCYSSAPVKQIVADLAADTTTGKGPAAILWNDGLRDDKNGGVDVVTYKWMEMVYFANLGSRRMLDMLQGYTKVMDEDILLETASRTRRRMMPRACTEREQKTIKSSV